MFQKMLEEWQEERVRTKFSVILTVREQYLLKEFVTWLDRDAQLRNEAEAMGQGVGCKHNWQCSSTTVSGYICAKCGLWTPTP
jgi:hypothetical protein